MLSLLILGLIASAFIISKHLPGTNQSNSSASTNFTNTSIETTEILSPTWHTPPLYDYCRIALCQWDVEPIYISTQEEQCNMVYDHVIEELVGVCNRSFTNTQCKDEVLDSMIPLQNATCPMADDDFYDSEVCDSLVEPDMKWNELTEECLEIVGHIRLEDYGEEHWSDITKCRKYYDVAIDSLEDLINEDYEMCTKWVKEPDMDCSKEVLTMVLMGLKSEHCDCRFCSMYSYTLLIAYSYH